jgi:hypothetical protein
MAERSAYRLAGALHGVNAQAANPVPAPPKLSVQDLDGTAPVARCVSDGGEVILGPQDQAISNEGWRGQRHLAEVVGAEQFVFVAGADRERPAFLVHTKDLAVVAPG